MQLRQNSQELCRPALLLPKSLLHITTIQIPIFTTDNHTVLSHLSEFFQHLLTVSMLLSIVVNMCCYDLLSNKKYFTHICLNYITFVRYNPIVLPRYHACNSYQQQFIQNVWKCFLFNLNSEFHIPGATHPTCTAAKIKLLTLPSCCFPLHPQKQEGEGENVLTKVFYLLRIQYHT